MAKTETFDLWTQEGWYEVEGSRLGDTLALTPMLVEGDDGETEYDFSRWTVTHVPTGRAVAGAESWSLTKRQAKAVGQAAVELGFDFETSADPKEAGSRLIEAGLGDLVLVLRLDALPKKRAADQVAEIQNYVAKRLRGAGPRHDRRAARRVPAARSKRRGRPSATKKEREKPVEAVDLLALARRARGENPPTGSQPTPVW